MGISILSPGLRVEATRGDSASSESPSMAISR